jgi:hypothetical protein
MRHLLRSKAAFCLLAVVLTGPLYAQEAAKSDAGKGPNSAACKEVQSACTSAGFVVHGESAGKGLYEDCMGPLLEGHAAPKSAKLPLPQVDDKVLTTCRADWKAKKAN